MEFLLLEDDGEFVMRQDWFIFYPDFNDGSTLRRLVSQCGEVDSEKMCRVLNMINNQGIESFKLRQYGYVLRGINLTLPDLSTGERIFMCAEIARQKKLHIYLYRGVNQLSIESQKKFFKEYKDCEYVHVLCEMEAQRILFRRRGEIS